MHLDRIYRILSKLGMPAFAFAFILFILSILSKESGVP